MAWRSSGLTNTALVENLCKNRMISSPVVKSAFLLVDRANYAPKTPYEDSPQSIGHKATISAPHMHAHAVESLLPYVLPETSTRTEVRDAEGDVVAGSQGVLKQGVIDRPRRVLDIGSGSGYLTHLFAELVGEGGVVVGVEHIKELKELGETNLAKSAEGQALLKSGRCRFRLGDGRKGWVEPSPSSNQPGVGGSADAMGSSQEEEGGWDAIHVGAAAVELHEELINQLRSPGRMFIPVGGKDGWDQYIWTVDKDQDGNVTKEKKFSVRYVPLTDAPSPN
jgi:protein-L-isoaspartate(D-aspartate) O-methyltransferase